MLHKVYIKLLIIMIFFLFITFFPVLAFPLIHQKHYLVRQDKRAIRISSNLYSATGDLLRTLFYKFPQTDLVNNNKSSQLTGLWLTVASSLPTLNTVSPLRYLTPTFNISELLFVDAKYSYQRVDIEAGTYDNIVDVQIIDSRDSVQIITKGKCKIQCKTDDKSDCNRLSVNFYEVEIKASDPIVEEKMRSHCPKNDQELIKPIAFSGWSDVSLFQAGDQCWRIMRGNAGHYYLLTRISTSTSATMLSD